MMNHRLILLSDRYISPVLMDCAVRRGIPVFPLKEELGTELSRRFTGLKLISEQTAAEIIRSGAKYYTNTEDVLSKIVADTTDQVLIDNINVFKDKFRFRELLKPLFDDFQYFQIDPENPVQVKLKMGKEYILKPNRGLFSIGIRKARTGQELEKAVSEMKVELARYKDIAETVLDTKKLILEECVSGMEYACDAAFDPDGKPVIYSIMQHPFSSPDDFRDVIYCTSREIMREMLPKVADLMLKISRLMGIRNFPVHFEFRVCDGELFPIEFNPLRFAAIGLSDLPHYAYGFNSFELYFDSIAPDWEKILAGKDERFYYSVLGVTPPGLEAAKPNLKGFIKTFKDLLFFEEFNPLKTHFFCLALARSEKREEMLKYLELDFNEFYQKSRGDL
ncbi:MAG: ATP-grasp domain-containing protein [Candidatus Wallbacteria bacterium]|nr:ATP-grasp domain-containing protein [Candidatus Wallbacteria bacterium]